MMSDIEHGLNKLTQEQSTIIYLRFGEGCDNVTLAKELSVTEDAARMRVNRAINNLLNYLGGSRPQRDKDYTEEEVNEQINADNGSDGDLSGIGEEVSRQDLD
jgi:DNA-directed RNA polymerase sigma subunit (sigma70/sigma32)